MVDLSIVMLVYQRVSNSWHWKPFVDYLAFDESSGSRFGDACTRYKIYIHTLHTLHYITLRYIALHYITLIHTSMHALHCIALHCIALHCIALHCIALHCIALHCIALHCIALHCIALHCIALHCIALHCIALHCIALHSYITLHYIALHYITLIHACMHACMHTSIHPSIHPCMHACIHTYSVMHTHTCIYIYIMCVCVCLCVCARYRRCRFNVDDVYRSALLFFCAVLALIGPASPGGAQLAVGGASQAGRSWGNDFGALEGDTRNQEDFQDDFQDESIKIRVLAIGDFYFSNRKSTMTGESIQWRFSTFFGNPFLANPRDDGKTRSIWL